MKIANFAVAIFIVVSIELQKSHSQPGHVVTWQIDAPSGKNSSSNQLSGNLVIISGEPLTNAIAIASGPNHGLGLKADGAVVGWGWNQAGQATGAVSENATHTNGIVAIGGTLLSGVKAISAGASVSMALKANGTIVIWGDDQGGLLAPPHLLRDVRSISVGWDSALAVRSDGMVVAWGRNARGEATVPPGLTDVRSATINISPDKSSLAIKSDGSLVRWGYDKFVPLEATNIIAIAVGGGMGFGAHCLALNNNGIVIGWGANQSGQATVPVELIDVVAIAAGGRHSLALKKNGEIVAWGAVTRVPIGLSNVVAIASSGNRCLAITTNAAVAERFRH
jgi:alpha-tubulin suppressor-like RCC1 family protein